MAALLGKSNTDQMTNQTRVNFLSGVHCLDLHRVNCYLLLLRRDCWENAGGAERDFRGEESEKGFNEESENECSRVRGRCARRLNAVQHLFHSIS